MSSADVLVVGQGIAGTLMARELLRVGLEVLVADPNLLPASSQVASGLVHPIVPRTGGLTWRAAELFPAVQDYYQDIAEETGQVFFHTMPMAFVADTEQDCLHWKRAAEKLGAAWLQWTDELPEMQGRCGAITRHSGRLDMHALCTFYKSTWMAEGRYHHQAVLWDELRFEGGYWYWGTVKARYVVLCQGAHAQGQSPLEALPFQLTQGELLSLRVLSPDAMPSYIVKKKVFSIPLGDGVYRVGSTYDWNNLETAPREVTRETLLQQFRELVPDAGAVEVLAHDAAIRPTVGRRRPFMGPHPEHPHIFICNGWGSKGASLAPLLVPELLACMLRGTPVHPETDAAAYWP
jgi:glycine/D-amino acid oxidase-like deaminating enzyme